MLDVMLDNMHLTGPTEPKDYNFLCSSTQGSPHIRQPLVILQLLQGQLKFQLIPDKLVIIVPNITHLVTPRDHQEDLAAEDRTTQ
jgi:hypothetical protein